MNIERIHCPLTVERKDADSQNEMGHFSGYGSVFGNVDLGGDIVEKGAFTKSLKEWNAKQEMPSMFGFHDFNNPIGDWVEMREDDHGLYVKGELWVKGEKRIEQAVVAHNIMRGTGPKGLSIGFRVKDQDFQEFEGGMIRHIKEVELMEVSVVGWAMNPQAKVNNVKGLTSDNGELLSIREMEARLRDAGLSRTQAKALLGGGYKAMFGDEQSDVKAVERDAQLDLGPTLVSLNSVLKRINK